MKFLPPKLFAALLGLWSIATIPATAQKAPELGYVYPPTVIAGETNEVQLGGYDFTSDMQFFVHDAGVKLRVQGKPGRFLVPEPPYWFGEKGRSTAMPIPREIPAALSIPQDHPTGLVRWQVANANGSSATGVFYVSNGREVLENRFRDNPQLLQSLPVGISGRLSKIAEIDRYSFQRTQEGPVTVQLLARTLGSNFNGVIEVRDSVGKIIADAADTQGVDTALTFFAQAGQRYTVHLHDVDFRGNRAYVYRLAITPGPGVLATVPAVGKRGTSQAVQFTGIGIKSGQPKLETITQTVSFPNSPGLDVLRHTVKTPLGLSAPFEIPLGNSDEEILAPAGKGLRRLEAPVALTDRMGDRPATFVWTAKKDDLFQVEASSRAFGGKLDLSLEIQDSEGKILVTQDDSPGTVDPSLIFKAPADGDYVCVVSDLSGLAGRMDSVYRLSLFHQPSGYVLTVPQQLNIKVGGKASLPLTVRRTGGHTAAIPIRIDGLPPGVTAPPAEKLIVPEGQSKLAIEFQCSDQCAAVAALIQITGQIQGESAVIAQAPGGGNLCPRDSAANQLDRVLVAMTLPPAFSVELVDKNRQRAVHRGTTYPAPFLIKRNEGFEGEIVLQMLARQGRHRQGIDAPVLAVPAEANEILYPCYLPEWLETDRTTRMVVLGVGWQKDPLGNLREITRQADARITMILEGALLRVAHRSDELTVSAGEAFEIPVAISRSAKLQVPVKLEVLVPAELQDHVGMDPPTIEFAVNQSKGKLRVDTSANSVVEGRWPLKIRATALQDGRWLVVSQTELSVQFNPSLAKTPSD